MKSEGIGKIAIQLYLSFMCNALWVMQSQAQASSDEAALRAFCGARKA